MTRILNWIEELYQNWKDDHVAHLSAALAYYTMFSLVPILLIGITIAGVLLGEEAARGQIIMQIDALVGDQAALGIQQMILNATHQKKSLNMQIISVCIILFSASGIFSEIQEGLNTIWKVKSNPKTDWFHFIIKRLLSFAMVLISSILLLSSIIITSLLAALSRHLTYFIGVDIFLELIMSYIFSFIMATLLFAMLFKHLPDIKLHWSNVWVGALITSFLFSLGKILIGFYLNHVHIVSVFGAAGSLIILLIWVYYSAQIFFLGAEITKIYSSKKN